MLSSAFSNFLLKCGVSNESVDCSVNGKIHIKNSKASMILFTKELTLLI